MDSQTAGKAKVLVTGATGYVGGRLVEALQRDGVALRCMARCGD